MAHSVEMGKDGILYAAIIGDMDEPSMQAYFKDMTAHFEGRDEQSLDILVDASREGKISPAARRVFMDLATYPQLRKVAIYNATTFSRVLGSFITRILGRKELFGFFAEEDEAREWLAVK
ncbi:MAG TPA: STAS/SEC14 domain-containing protein [Anaerolineae bacterium]|nr:STAS/SEC14 domain-containing protein [Anaerolineae bacterium]